METVAKLAMPGAGICPCNELKGEHLGLERGQADPAEQGSEEKLRQHDMRDGDGFPCAPLPPILGQDQLPPHSTAKGGGERATFPD